MDVTLDLPIRLAVLELDDVLVSDDPTAADEMEECASALRDAYGEDASPGVVAGIQRARTLFRALGIDPTKRRPSSEALLQRALQGKPMPRVSSLVDVGNWWSLEFLLPLGLYDRDRVEPPVTLRLGREGEAYAAIGDKTINLAGRYALVDTKGPFGSPITDSLRTAVSEGTTRAVVFVYAPIDEDEAAFRASVETLAERVGACCGGRVVGMAIH